MKILHISYSLNEQSAAYRLAEEQAINQGHKIYFMLARKSKSTFIESRRISPFLTSFIGFTSHLFDHLLRKCLVCGDEVFSIGINFPLKNWIFSRLVYKTNPDIIHRLWEVLYSKRVPVIIRIKECKIYDLYTKFPILILDDINDLKNAQLIEELYHLAISKYFNDDLLNYSYWEKMIKDDTLNLISN